MAQLVVRRVEEEVKRRLKRRASRHGRSMEEEVREILRDAAKEDGATPGGLGTEIAALFTDKGLTAPIREIRGIKLRIPKFRR